MPLGRLLSGHEIASEGPEDEKACSRRRQRIMGASPPATDGELLIGDDLPVTRRGLGSMRITDKGIWGERTDRTEAVPS
jgi:pyridoxine 4-dehydrogenase